MVAIDVPFSRSAGSQYVTDVMGRIGSSTDTGDIAARVAYCRRRT
jgi:hypothetical protein